MRRRLPGRRRRPAPWPVVGLIAVLVAVAIGAVAWAERLGAPARPVSWVSVLGLLVALTVSAYLHVEFRHGDDDDVDALDLFEAALAPALFLLPGAGVVALVVAAKVASEVLLRVRPVKGAFNVAAWAAAAAVGSLVLAALGATGTVGGRDVPGLVAAMVAVAIVNQVAFVSVLRLAERRTFRQVLAEIRPAIVPGWLVGGGVTLSFGLLFAAACTWSPAVAWLLPVPLGALHWASQSYAASRADVARVRGLHQATRTLSSSCEASRAIPAFLDQVRASFGAAAVDLVTCDGGGASVQRAVGVAPDVAGGRPAAREVTAPEEPDLDLAGALLALDEGARVTALSPDPVVSEGLRRRGWRDCLVAPVPTAGGTRRALCVYDPRGVVTSDRTDLTVLEGLAGEVGGALARAEAQGALLTSEARFRALVQHSSDMVMVLDADGVVTDVLPSGSSSPLPLEVGRHVADGAHPDDAPVVREHLDRLVRQPGSAGALTWRTAAADGSWRHVESTLTVLLDAPAVAGVVMNTRDTTERERAVALLTGQAEVLGAISRRSPLGETMEALARTVEAQAPGSRYTVVLFAEADGSATVMGSPLPSALVAELAGALAPEAAGGVVAATRRTVVVGDVADDPRWHAAVADHEMRAVWAASIDRSDGSGCLGLAVLHFERPRVPDESDRRVLESAADLAHIALEAVATQARLVHQATHDPLTGLPNRLLFLDRTSVALSRLSRSAMSVAVLFVDLDRFKTVNDSLGHDVGDRLLISLADRLKAIMRPSDSVARFGGDEFTILCEDIHDQGEAAAIATRVREVLTEPVTLEGHELYVTASVGIAHTADHGRDAQQLVEDADAAMYRAKRAGGDVQQVYDATVRSRALLDLVTYEALRKAIDRNELLVHYQPTVDLRTGRIVGAEALVRWDHVDHGIVGPLDFIPLAEETGLILPLGMLVLNEACSQSRRWAAEAGAAFTMSVNLSAHQFTDPKLPDTVAAALATCDVQPSALALEITESTLMEHVDSTMAILHALKDLGVRLVIDDFGTGYSSLTYLKRFPVDVIKVDKSFVDGLGRDPGDEAIVAAVVDLAHTFGMTAVAEGVETETQVRLLQALDCDLAQGYWFSPPVPAPEVVFEPASIVLPR